MAVYKISQQLKALKKSMNHSKKPTSSVPNSIPPTNFPHFYW